MIQTGSVGGNAFDASGLDSFGSQSFFHGFFLTGADIRMLNAFDAVACFALCLLFVAEVSLRWRLPWFVGVLGVICVMVINPQSTNISPLYSGALFIAALVVYGSFFERTWLAKRTSRGFRTEVSLALIASTLATLKVTLAFFASLFLLLLYALLFSRTLDRRGVFKSAVTTGLLTAVLILPWVLVQAPVLAQARQLGLEFSDRATLVTKYPSIAAHDIAKLFSTAPLFYGNRLPNFHFLAGICLGIGLLSLPGWLRPPGCTRSVGLSSLVAAGVAVPAVYLLNAHLFMAETAIRYSCPVLIACVAVTCVSFLRFGSASVLPDYRQRVLWVSSLLAVVLLVFAGSFWLRAGLAIHQGISVSFPVDQTYAMLSTQAVARDQTIYLRAIQSRTEPGTAALVWMVAPFHLDFSRNHLFVVSQPGLISPALHFPAGADLESLETYLRKWGIRYVLIEASSPVMDETAREWKRLLTAEYTVYRKLSAYALYFRESLLALAARHRVVYTDGRTLLYELDAPTGTEAGPPASPVHTGDSP